MKFLTQKTDALSRASGCSVVFALDNALLTTALALDDALGGVLSQVIKSGDLKAKPGQSCWIPVPAASGVKAARVLLVHLGETSEKKSKIASGNVISALQSAAAALSASPAKDTTVFIDDLFADGAPTIEHFGEPADASWVAEQMAKLFVTASYRYTETFSKPEPAPALGKVTYASDDATRTRAVKSALLKGAAIGEGMNLTRQLGNLPGNICTPAYLVEQAKQLAAACPKLTTKSLNEKQIEKLGMGAFHSVAKGSDLDAQLIIMEYKGAGGAKSQPHVLVGKGITFDTGGISLKPGANMDEMKFDMGGAASVFGAMKALIEMDAKVHVIGVIAAAENMPSGRASKPGDIVTSMSGQTIEILNTDAEGRLVLCDTLTYVERFKPKSVVDIATLTGACVIALGNHATGLYSNEQALADKLLAAGVSANDRAWQMPLWDDYQNQLDSNFADMANIGGPAGGSVTAACFLSRFTKSYPWAHLDIAGTAWQSGAKKGSTGRPVSLLVNYLLNA